MMRALHHLPTHQPGSRLCRCLLPALPVSRAPPSQCPHSRAARAPRAKSERDSLIDYETLEVAVPALQRPINELKQVKEGALYKWATLELPGFAGRLAAVYGAVFALIGGPIAYQTFDPAAQFPLFFLAASVGSLLVTTIVTLRIYLGWSYVGERLLSATIEYEETGWYDGQTYVKPPEVLARDRLLGTYEVNPVMKRLRYTMLSTGGSLVLCAALLIGATKATADADGMFGRGAARRAPAQVTPTGILYSKNIKTLEELMNDDEAAAAEQAAQGGIPGYCGDRYYKSFAGGEKICAKFEKGTR